MNVESTYIAPGEHELALGEALLARASEMIPVLRSRERAAIEAGQVPPETIAAPTSMAEGDGH